jgi:hypothetical protein
MLQLSQTQSIRLLLVRYWAKVVIGQKERLLLSKRSVRLSSGRLLLLRPPPPTYSASVVDMATEGFSLVFQLTAPPANRNTKPVVGRLETSSLA